MSKILVHVLPPLAFLAFLAFIVLGVFFPHVLAVKILFAVLAIVGIIAAVFTLLSWIVDGAVWLLTRGWRRAPSKTFEESYYEVSLEQLRADALKAEQERWARMTPEQRREVEKRRALWARAELSKTEAGRKCLAEFDAECARDAAGAR